LQNTALHNTRFNNARKALFGSTDYVDIEGLIEIPANIGAERYKCRVLTDGSVFEVQINKYEQRKVETLKIIECNEIEYTYKLENRDLLNRLYEQRGACDDIIIVKNGLVSDSWAANLLFFDGKQWLTPANPLLKGTQREFLLKKGIVSEKEIPLSEIRNYKKIKLINAMIDFERAGEIGIDSVF
jgi:4-amino-4-deoxychorismate lyase